MNKIDLRSYIPPNIKLEESLIQNDGKELGWNYTLVDKDRKALGSGTHIFKTTAKIKAISEFIERHLIKQARETDKNNHFGFDIDNSSTGFAIGLTKESTKLRSLLEAIERWALSSWIDHGRAVKEAKKIKESLDPLSTFLCREFDSLYFYQTNFPVEFLESGKVTFGAVLGIKNSGVFLGTNTATVQSDLWMQACIELHRSLKIYQRNGRFKVPEDKILKRIDYFGSNMKEAFSQIQSSKNLDFDYGPRVQLCREFDSGTKGLYFYRSLIKDCLPLSIGNEKRFVY